MNLARCIGGYLPISGVSIEVNRFAFMKIDDPKIAGAAYQKGPMHGFRNECEAIETIQGKRCLLCGAPIAHLHHVVPKSPNGMDTLENLAGLCGACHDAVHKDVKAQAALGKLKKGTRKKHAGASVLNQIMPALLEDLAARFPDRVHVTEGFETKKFASAAGIQKTHAADAYCIACAAISRRTVMDPPKNPFEMKQYRQHDRARIKARTQRVYRLDGRIVARNRSKAEGQTEDSLEEWYAKAVREHGKKTAKAMRSRLTVSKSRRRYNNTKRILPGAVFGHQGKRRVLRGQQNQGRRYIFEDMKTGEKAVPAKECILIAANAGLVFL